MVQTRGRRLSTKTHHDYNEPKEKRPKKLHSVLAIPKFRGRAKRLWRPTFAQFKHRRFRGWGKHKKNFNIFFSFPCTV